MNNIEEICDGLPEDLDLLDKEELEQEFIGGKVK